MDKRRSGALSNIRLSKNKMVKTGIMVEKRVRIRWVGPIPKGESMIFRWRMTGVRVLISLTELYWENDFFRIGSTNKG